MQYYKITNHKPFRIFKVVIGIYLGFRICNLGFVTPTHAQSVGLSISPPVTEILLSPNKKVEQAFIIKNQGQDIYITPTLHTVVPNGLAGHVIVSPTPLIPSELPLIATLSTAPNSQVLLRANSSMTINLTLEGASVDEPIDSYLALVITPSLPSNISGLTSTAPAISALVLSTLTPSAIIPASLEVEDFELALLHDTYHPFAVSPVLVNSGNIMLRPEGSFKIISPSGKIVYENSLYPHLLLKDSKRIIKGRNYATPPAALPLAWSPAWHNLGPHKIILTITTIGGTKLTEIERVVWFMPIRAIISVLLLAIMVSILIISQRKTKVSKTTIDTPLE